MVCRNCTSTDFDVSQGQGDKSGFVALAPSNHPVVLKLAPLFTDVLSFKVKTYESFDEMKKYIEDSGSSYLRLDENGNKNQICFGISFDEGDAASSKKWTYNFHYNLTGNSEYRDLYGFDEEEERVRPFEIESFEYLKRNIKSGMYYLINFIDTEILRLVTSNDNAYINADLVLAPTQSYKTSTIYNNLNGNMDMLIFFPILVVFLRFTYLLLFEKEHKIA